MCQDSKAKYYSDGNLLKAKPKRGSSYTWQNILAGLECFKRGYIWRVGDGSQIKIWEDCQIPSSHNLKILTPRGNNLVTNVEELINPVDGNWDEQMIRDLFWSAYHQQWMYKFRGNLIQEQASGVGNEKVWEKPIANPKQDQNFWTESVAW